MKAILLLTAFCLSVASSHCAEPEKFSAQFTKANSFDVARYYVAVTRKILVITPEAITCGININLHTNGTMAEVLSAIETATTNQTPVRWDKSDPHRISLTGPIREALPPANGDGLVSFQGADVSQVLRVYGAMGNATLIITPEALMIGGSIKLEATGSREEIKEKIAEAIANQSDVRLTQLDKDHIAVTLKGQKIPEKD